MFWTICMWYMAVALLVYGYSALSDYLRYKRTGVIDGKFPITSWPAQKMVIAISFLWLPIAIGLLYAGLTSDDHDHLG